MRRLSHIVRAAWTSSDALLYLLTAVASSVVTWFALDLRGARLDAPFEYSGDALAVGAHVKTTLETGWYEHQALLGAPYGQTYHDFPQADNLHLVAIKLIGLFTQDWPVALNLYFILGFPLAALAAVWFFRTVGASRLLTMALSVVFAIAPYHFMRGEGHLWLGSYYGVPLGVGLLVLLLQGTPLWGRGRSSNSLLSWLFSPASRTLVFITVLAMSGSYYGVFFLVILAVTGVALLVRDGDWRRFWGAVTAGIVTVLVLVLNMLPDIIYGWVNGPNSGGLERSASESEIYALKLTQLLMPWPGHRVPFLQDIRAVYDSQYPLVSEHPALGALGALGLTIGFLVIAYLAFAWRRLERRATPARDTMERVAWLSGLMFVAFLFATVGGLSTVISFATDALRGWNRMSIVILALALGVLGLAIDAGLRSIRRRLRGGIPSQAILSAVVAAMVIVVGYVDQTPVDVTSPRAAAAEAFDADAARIREISEQMPPGSMVLQLPYIPFPESSSVTGTLGSEELVPYLHSEDLRWSGGGIKGRPRSDYPLALQQYPGEDVARLATAAGFDGILIDRTAMPDRSEPLETGIANAVGEQPLVSADERYAFFALEGQESGASSLGSEERERLSSLVTDPVSIYPDEGFSSALGADGYPEYTTVAEGANLTLVNPSDDEVMVNIRLSAGSDAEAVSHMGLLGRDIELHSSLEFEGASGTQETQTKPVAPETVVAVAVPPGTHEITLENRTGGRLTLRHVRVIPDDVAAFLEATRDAR